MPTHETLEALTKDLEALAERVIEARAQAEQEDRKGQALHLGWASEKLKDAADQIGMTWRYAGASKIGVMDLEMKWIVSASQLQGGDRIVVAFKHGSLPAFGDAFIHVVEEGARMAKQVEGSGDIYLNDGAADQRYTIWRLP